MENYDFSGWATVNNLMCSDGLTIMKDAFKHNDGNKVPLVWNHQHNDPNNVLGHAVLENREEGVYAYCKFNDTDSGEVAKKLVHHGDVVGLSIYANGLKKHMSHVMHGNIRELSLVLARANPGAKIDSIIMHGEYCEDDAIITTGEPIELFHAEEGKQEDKKVEENKKTEKTVKEIINSMNEDQKTVLYAMVGQALEDGTNYDDEDEDEDVKHSEGGNEEMKHNVFDNEMEQTGGYLSHSAQEEIIALAKSSQVGSLQAAIQIYAEENSLQHAEIETAAASGFAQTGHMLNGTTQGLSILFPEYRDARPGDPQLLTDDQGWVSQVMKKVSKVPFSRIRTSHVDIRKIDEQKAAMDQLRARGYKKGTKKGIVGNYNLVRRTTDPQTIYVKSALHRDDIIDITDLDIAAYQYNIDRMQLNEELATAIMFGDGRTTGAEGKIEEDKIRPVWTDDDLYTLHVDIDFAAARNELQGTGTGVSFGENYIKAEAMVNACLYAREKFKGSGTPDMYIEPHQLNIMLLARDMNGRRIYSTKAELAQALNVANIYTVEQMAGKTRTDAATSKTKKLYAIIANLADYSVGATKGGEITHFTQFDIDFNQQKSLLETRCSGALTRVYSAIAIEEDVTPSSSGGGTDPEEETGA